MRAEIEVYLHINLPSGKEIVIIKDDASALLDALQEHYGETSPKEKATPERDDLPVEAWRETYNRVMKEKKEQNDCTTWWDHD